MNQSPTLPKEKSKQMDFPEAIRQIIAGKKVTRLEWKDENIYGILKDGYLMIYRESKFHQWTVNEEDMIRKDWIVVNR